MTPQRGDRVWVHEEGIRPWRGRVLSVKPSSKSGLWIEVRRADGATFAIQPAADGLPALEPDLEEEQT